MREVQKSCGEILQQAQRLLAQLSDAQYRHPGEPYASSIGQHLRHVLDHFHALRKALDSGVVNYDLRHRGERVETDKACGLTQLQAMIDWLPAIATEDLGRAVSVRTEVSVTGAHSVAVPSSFGRELVFAASHAVHHYAVITMLAREQGVFPEADFGLAPATASFLRAVTQVG